MTETVVFIRTKGLLLPPQEPQRQDSLLDQLFDLHHLAGRHGMYDAADWLWKQLDPPGRSITGK